VSAAYIGTAAPVQASTTAVSPWNRPPSRECELEATTAVSMMPGVLVGLLIADGARPSEELDIPTTRIA
jgi:hypothetical protein